MTIVLLILAFLTTITIHEWAHGYVADKLGDPTARIAGRLTLNPLAHIDPYGTLLIPFILSLIGAPVIGWAKPVPVDPYNLANPKKDSALISLAGPLINILLATILALIVRFVPLTSIIDAFFFLLIQINVSLAVFNLIPIHPLDGGKILVGLLPSPESERLDLILHRMGTMFLIFMIFPLFGGQSLVSIVISPAIKLILNLLLPH